MKNKFEEGLNVAGGFDQEFKKPTWFNQKLFDEGRQECVFEVVHDKVGDRHSSCSVFYSKIFFGI